MERRVYELASMLGVTNKQMIDILWENNISVKNHMSRVEENDISEIIKKQDLFNQNIKSHENKSSLKSIKINKLFNKEGYNYKFDFKDDINILIAENGSGKTTILNIIIALLNGNVKKLVKLPFESIEIQVNDVINIINRKDLIDSSFYKKEIVYLLRKIKDRIPYSKYEYLTYKIMNDENIDAYEIENLIYKYSGKNYIRRENNQISLFSEIDDEKYPSSQLHYKLRKSCHSNKIINLVNEISEKIKKQEEIIDFPTYRRIEEDLDKVIELSEKEKNELRYKLNNSTLNFGISDVKNIIEQLTEKLREDANDYYTKMNAEVLNDLLSNKVKLNVTQKNQIDKDKINIIIGRIGEDKIKELDKLRNFIDNTSEVENSEFLQYYIFKLINIYEAQKPIDEKIKNYKDVCNKYLVNKSMIYDEVRVKVIISDDETKEEIFLEQLSSGEKQILSLFAKLYLTTTKPSIFIIDEPELSLSIIWQKSLLEDIYASNKINLLIATTHSPFIFKNQFRTFTKELDSTKEVGNK
ncbi:translation initiation factor IF-2 N-terminal domain-containing protein [Clostridium beijerinckii]|uniref:translation initiation factor IF-2 N-terminal domain-containing protein n=1 Tax=Clostridium beijerinckii TaxID=1520 RepID=UPI00030393CA|nr:translation initiation factor IF-2 N-terminal domain-containing protein [Clostridium beijerinckii]